MFKFYEVGGTVRDSLMGLQSKDIDYVVVPNDELLQQTCSVTEMFEKLLTFLNEENYMVFLVTPECYTIRAKFPPDHKYHGVADFVLARKEVGYVEGTRQPMIVPGTLFDDLQRRDFTVNALAKDPDTGEIIDYFNGIEHLKERILKTPISGLVTFEDDPLRLLRAIRFAITKDFDISLEIHDIIENFDYEGKMGVVSEERIREEIYKCFKHDTLKTLEQLEWYSKLKVYIFTKTNLWLKPTNEQ